MKHHQISIILDRCLYAGNIGASARAMKTMNISDLRLVQPANFPAREAQYRAAAAIDIVNSATVHPSLTAAIADCDLVVATSARRRQRSLPLLSVREFCQQLPNMAYDRVGWLFGKEDSGLDEAAMLRANYHVYIPSSEQYPVLNLAMCVQIVCYELSLALPSASQHTDHSDHYAIQSQKPPHYATSEELENLYTHLDRIADSSGFLNPKQPKQLRQKLRHLFQRTRLRHNEVQILRGLLAACERKMQPAQQRQD